MRMEVEELLNAEKAQIIKVIKPLSTIQSEILFPTARTFITNIKDTLSLAILPYSLMMYAQGIAHGTKELVELEIHLAGDSEEVRKRKLQELHERAGKEAGQKVIESEQFQMRLREQAYSMLDGILRVDLYRSSLRSLILAVISEAWTAFETLATDGWEAVLNARPLPLAQNALTVLSPSSESSDISRKHISVGLLAKYAFDLRNNMGTVMKSRFDFTSVSGIGRAFTSVFGKTKELEEVVGNHHLSALEASRHLIVHRAGIVDDEFRRRTASSAPLGSPFPLEGDTTKTLVNAAAESGVKLLSVCDDWLIRHAK